MDCKFQVGDPVVCVEELTWIEALTYLIQGPIIDELYHISDMRICDCGQRHVLIRLRELPLPEHLKDRGYIHTMFRKAITVEEFISKDVGLPVNSGDKVIEYV